ncbi:MAG: hypothetical protein KTR20_09770 [Cellvibrionaceae bacterium]|nr:hypothetical protein [Cellvibrionaceae bacterium]
MIKIRQEQMQVFENIALQKFEDDMLIHSKQFAPQRCDIIGDKQLRLVIRQAIDRASHYQLTLKGPVTLYIEMVFLFGSGFDTDPQYPEFHLRLTDSGNQQQRAEALYNYVMHYQDTVYGPDNIYTYQALSQLTKQQLKIRPNHFVDDLTIQLETFYPQKAIYATPNKIIDLVDFAKQQAQDYGFSSHGAQVLMVILMIAFGHHCTHDPLYPWIAHTLNNSQLSNTNDRAKLLGEKAKTWLTTILRDKQALC